MRRKIVLSLVFATTVLGSNAVPAAVITPIGGSTSSFIGQGSIANVIDGIIDYDSFLQLGESGWGFGGPYSVMFDLGGSFDLTAMNLWNNAGNIEFDGEGIDAFALRFLDSGSVLLDTVNGNAIDTLAQQTFALSTSNVAFVELVINSNPGLLRKYVDFYEINFEGSPAVAVPEPTTSLLLMAGIATVFGVRKMQVEK